jgi:hypothetical protein
MSIDNTKLVLTSVLHHSDMLHEAFPSLPFWRKAHAGNFQETRGLVLNIDPIS